MNIEIIKHIQPQIPFSQIINEIYCKHKNCAVCSTNMLEYFFNTLKKLKERTNLSKTCDLRRIDKYTETIWNYRTD